MTQDTLQKFDLPVGFSEENLQRMLTSALDQGCSDVKIQSGDYVTVKWRRAWTAFSLRALDETETARVLNLLAGPTAVSQLGGGGEIDAAPEFFRHDQHRVRVRLRLNAVACRVGGIANGISMTMRTIPSELPKIEKLGLSDDLVADLIPRYGSVLIVGATGSGKTTTIAGLLNYRLGFNPQPCILTYESPVEFPYDKRGFGNGPLVTQCEIGEGRHLKTWGRATVTAMRRTGDIILMGEVRDPETADATMEMGITGHCVYATLHADTCHETIFRLVELFPEGARSAAAAKMLSSLRAICAQKIITLLNGQIVALRSWIIFDYKIKEDLQSPEWPYPRWSTYVRNYVRERGQDFASQCIPYILAGTMDENLLREIAQMGRQDAQKFVESVRAKAAAQSQEAA